MPEPAARPRSNAISGSRDFLGLKPSQQDLKVVFAARDGGINRGVDLMSRMTIDVESIFWSAGQSLVSTTASNLKFGFQDSPPEPTWMGRSSTDIREVGLGTLSNFIEWVFEQVEDKLLENEWVKRLCKLLGMGINVVSACVKKALLDKETLKALIPFYAPIKGAIDSGIKAYNAASAAGAMSRIKEAAPQIGSGIPTVMLSRFREYLSEEEQLTYVKTVYTFRKTLVSLLISVFAAPAASAMAWVTSIVEAVSSFFYLVYQSLAFRKATDKCRDG